MPYMTGGITWYNPFSKWGPHPKVGLMIHATTIIGL